MISLTVGSGVRRGLACAKPVALRVFGTAFAKEGETGEWRERRESRGGDERAEGETRERRERRLRRVTASDGTPVSGSVRVKTMPREIVKYAHWEINECEMIHVKESQDHTDRGSKESFWFRCVNHEGGGSRLPFHCTPYARFIGGTQIPHNLCVIELCQIWSHVL